MTAGSLLPFAVRPEQRPKFDCREERQRLPREDVDRREHGCDGAPMKQGEDDRRPAAAQRVGDDGEDDTDAEADRRSRPGDRQELAERGGVFLLQPRQLTTSKMSFAFSSGWNSEARLALM